MFKEKVRIQLSQQEYYSTYLNVFKGRDNFFDSSSMFFWEKFQN